MEIGFVKGLAAVGRSSLTDHGDNPELKRLFAELGEPLTGYSPNLKPGLMTLGIAAVVIAVLSAMPQQIWMIWVIWIASITAVMGLAMIWPEVRSQGYRICSGGVVVTTWRRIEGFRWRDIATLELLSERATMEGWSLAGSGGLKAVIGLDNRRRFVLKWLAPQVMAFIEQETNRELLPRVKNELNTGRPVKFGDVTLRTDGLEYQRKLVLWEDVESVEFSHTVVVRKKDGSSIYAFYVPNSRLFMELAQARLATGRFDLTAAP